MVQGRIGTIFGLLVLIFLVIPLIVSAAYGNIPFINKSPLYSSDVIVSSDKQLLENTNMPIFIKTYTWSEIKRYILRKEVTFGRVFRNIVALFLTAVISITLDRMLFRKSPTYLRRK